MKEKKWYDRQITFYDVIVGFALVVVIGMILIGFSPYDVFKELENQNDWDRAWVGGCSVGCNNYEVWYIGKPFDYVDFNGSVEEYFKEGYFACVEMCITDKQTK